MRYTRETSGRRFLFAVSADTAWNSFSLLLDEWLLSPQKHRKQLRAALILFCAADDARLKNTALQCARVSDDWCSLKEEAFQILADTKGDEAVEQFFVEYFVHLPEPPQYRPKGSDILEKIAHSFWE